MFHATLFGFFFFFSSRRRHTRYWRDWSSDVCSSDLGEPPHRDHPRFDHRDLDHDVVSDLGELFPLLQHPLDEIGRASCRERVYISVVAGPLKKKQSAARSKVQE